MLCDFCTYPSKFVPCTAPFVVQITIVCAGSFRPTLFGHDMMLLLQRSSAARHNVSFLDKDLMLITSINKPLTICEVQRPRVTVDAQIRLATYQHNVIRSLHCLRLLKYVCTQNIAVIQWRSQVSAVLRKF